MSDDSRSGPENAASDRFGDVDRSLQDWVQLVHTGQLEAMGVTLAVHGLLISGQVVSGAEYFKHVVDQFIPGLPRMEQREFLARVSATVLSDTADLPDAAPPRYIHLRDAHIVGPSGQRVHADEPMWWRLPLAAVDGFMLGTLRP